MVKQIIDVGIQGNDATGDAIRDAFKKANDNFTELYASMGNSGGLTFTGLVQTPNTLVPNNILITNPTGTTLLQKELVVGEGLAIDNTSPTSLVLINTGGSVYADKDPHLGGVLNANRFMIHNLPDPADYSSIASSLGVTQDRFVVSKKFADLNYVRKSVDDTSTNYISVPAGATGAQVPQKQEVVGKAGGSTNQMTGPLLLAADPDNTSDLLTAATKNYVDTSSFTSQVNFFVSTNGDNYRPSVLESKRGRALAYAFGSINRACLAAEAIQNAAGIQLGPYTKPIYYDDNASRSVVDAVTQIGFTDGYYLDITHSGPGTDPRKGTNYDIRSGLYFRGTTSGAIALIDYVGTVSASTERYNIKYVNDYTFALGEELEYGDTVKKPQITIHVESGEYFENYPIRVPENVSIVGDEMRRVIVRPKEGISSSKWSNLYFRRDITIDGLTLVTPTMVGTFTIGQTYTIADLGSTTNNQWNTIAGTSGKVYNIGSTFVASDIGTDLGTGTAYCPYGYHYLTDPSRSLYSNEIANSGGATVAQAILNANRSFIQAETIGWTNEYFKAIITGAASDTNTLLCVSNAHLNVGMPIRFAPITTYVTAVALDTNYVTVKSSSGMIAGQPFTLTGTAIGEFATATTYYVLSIVNSTTITVSDTLAGPAKIFAANATGLMTLDISTAVFAGLSANTTYYVKEKISLDRFSVSETIVGTIPGTTKALTASSVGTAAMQSNFYYNQVTCSRDIGLIADAMGFDLLYGDFYKCLEAGISYFSNASGLIAIGNQLTQTAAAITYMSTVVNKVLNLEAPVVSYQYTLTPILQNFDFDPAEAGATDTVTALGQLLVNVITGDDSVNLPKDSKNLDVFLLNNATILRMFTCQGHGGFMSVLDPDGQILNKSPFVEICASFSRSINSQTFAGGMFVDGFAGNLIGSVTTRIDDQTLIVQSEAFKIKPPLTPCSFYILGFRYEVDYTDTYVQSTGTITLYLNNNTADTDAYTNRGSLITTGLSIELVAAGNRSMVTTHYTQINDLGYGLVATNNALVEAVSIFTYYCYRALYSVNGAQVRSLNGSNSYGVYGIAADGSDPSEVAYPGNLYYPMTQTATVYKQGNFITTGAAKGTTVAITGYNYVPFDLSMLEIDHNGVVMYYEVLTATTTTVTGVLQLNLSTSGNNNTSSAGLLTDLLDGTPLIIRNLQNFRFNNILNTAPTRPSTALKYSDETDVYRILSYNLANMPYQEAILGSTVIYNYVSINPHATAGILPGTGQTGDTKANVVHLTNAADIARLIGKTFAWGNTVHTIIGYETPTNTGQAWARITFTTGLSKSLLNGTGTFSISSVSRVGPLSTTSVARVGSILVSSVSRVGTSVIASVARTGSTATIVTVSDHRLTTGDSVVISGTNLTGFDATATVTVTNSTTFTYTNSGAVVTTSTQPATATASLATPKATITTQANHGLTTGNTVTISNTGVLNFDAASVTVTVTGLTTFTYTNVGNSVATTSATSGKIAASFSNIATIVTGTNHGLTTGDLVTISGTSTLGFDATNIAVTVTGATTFTYSNVGDTLSTTAFVAVVTTAASNIATVTTSTAHGLSTLNYVNVTGTGLVNTTGAKVLSVSTYTFTYANSGNNLATTSVSSSTVTGNSTIALRAGMNNSKSLKVVSVARSSNVATIVTSEPHNLITGRLVNLFGITITTDLSPGFNASGYAVTVVNDYTFTYSNTGTSMPTTTAITGVVQYATQLTVSTISRATNIGTVVTTTAHGLVQDDTVSIINTDFIIITSGTTASTDTVTITKSSSDGGNTYTTTNTTTGLIVGMPIVFNATGNVASGITSGTTYYIKTIASTTTITLSDTPPSGSFGLLQLNDTTQVGSASVGYGFGSLNVNVLKVISSTSFTYISQGAAQSAVSFTIAKVVPRLPITANVTVYISLTRCTGHDFLSIGTGGFADTNYPNNIFGSPNNPPLQSQEVAEIGNGRCFYVSTDQYGNFRVGSYFKVDQGTGTVTFAASIALSNLDGIGFKRGVTVAEFSTDDTMTNNATDTVPVQSAIRSYVDRRLGITQSSSSPVAVPIGPGFFARNGVLPATGNFNMANYKIINLLTPDDLTDAANKGYVDNVTAYVNTFLKLSGGTRIGVDSFTMSAATSGQIDMNSNKILNVATPTLSTDASNKSYVDAQIALYDTLEELNDTTIIKKTSITITSFTSKTGTGPYLVTFAIPTQTTAPTTGFGYVLAGNSTSGYNGTFNCTTSTTTSITLSYPSDPGTYGTGVTTITTSGLATADILIYNGTKWVNAAQSGSITTTFTTFNISQIYRTSNIATVVTASAHGLVTGDKVTIPSVAINNNAFAGFRGSYSITRTDSVTFTYTNTGANVTSVSLLSGTATATSGSNNFVLVSSTASMVVGSPIQFTGSTIGNLAANTVYWVKTINSLTTVPIAQVSRSGSTVTANTGGVAFNITSFTSKSGSGPYIVVFGIATQASAPTTGISYLVSGNANANYNGSYTATASTTTSITLSYPTDPGVYGSGTTTAQYLSAHGLTTGQVLNITGTSLVDQSAVSITVTSGTQFTYTSGSTGTIAGTSVSGTGTPQPQITISSTLGGATLTQIAATGSMAFTAAVVGVVQVVSSGIASGVIVDSMVSSSAAIAQSKLSLSRATAATNTGGDLATFGIAGFNSANFSASSGFVSIADRGVSLPKLASIANNTVLGNTSGISNQVNTVTVDSGNSNNTIVIRGNAGEIAVGSLVATSVNVRPSDYATNGGYVSITKLVGNNTTATIQAGDTIQYTSLLINPNGGNVGINYASPTAKLHVATTSSTAYGLISQSPIVGLTTGNYVNMAYFADTRGTNNDGLRIVNVRDSTGSGNGNWETSSYRIRRSVDYNDGTSGVQEEIVFGNNLLAFNTASAERMRIDSSGHILPGNNNTQNLGSSGLYWSNLYATNHYGTLQTASQPNITGVGTLVNLTVTNTITGSVSGNAGTVGGLAVASGRNNVANQVVRTDGSGYLQCGYINSSNGNEGNNSSPTRIWGTNGVDDYMRTYLTSALVSGQVTINYNNDTNSNFQMLWGSGNSVFGTGGIYCNPYTDQITASQFNGNATSANYADLAENYEGDQEYEFGTVVMIGGEKEVTLAKGLGTTKVAGVVSENPAHLMNAGCSGIKIPVALQGRVPCKVIGKVEKGDLLVVSMVPGVAMVSTDPKPGSIIGKALANYDSDRIGMIEVLVGKH